MCPTRCLIEEMVPPVALNTNLLVVSCRTALQQSYPAKCANIDVNTTLGAVLAAQNLVMRPFAQQEPSPGPGSLLEDLARERDPSQGPSTYIAPNPKPSPSPNDILDRARSLKDHYNEFGTLRNLHMVPPAAMPNPAEQHMPLLDIP
eukprot:gene18316-5830_t